MKIERYFKYFSFGLAGFTLFLIYSDLTAGKTSLRDYLSNIGLLLISIEMGVLMTHEKLTAEVTLKNLFSKESLVVSTVGVLAYTLGKIGFSLLIINLIMGFI